MSSSKEGNQLTQQYYSSATNRDYKNKEAMLTSLQNNCLSLRLTPYVYEQAFKYEIVCRIRTKYKLTQIGYFD
jgi:hypothetical protein